MAHETILKNLGGGIVTPINEDGFIATAITTDTYEIGSDLDNILKDRITKSLGLS